jgi:hypothetical protein
MLSISGSKSCYIAAGLLLILFTQGQAFQPTPLPLLRTEAAPTSLFCPPLPAPTGSIIEVHSEQELWDAANTAPPGTTILIADGTYHLAQNGYYIWLDTPNVTLRSKSGNREAVILDDAYAGSETITIAASNVTVADLTIKHARTHPIHVVTSGTDDTLDALIYNVHIIDPGQQAVKINPSSPNNHYVDSGTVACSHIELTGSGQAKVLEINGSCYTGGIDAHQARGWTIRDNLIEGFWCQAGLSEHAIHAWTGSRDTLVERNQLVNDARGIGFGLQQTGSGRTYSDNPCPTASGYVDHYGGIIRNNFISAYDPSLLTSGSGFDSGIALAQACEAQVVHNTVASTQTPRASSIEWRFSNTSAQIENNLTSYRLWQRDGASASLAGNLSNAPLSLFSDPATGDLHLLGSASAAIDQGVTLPAGLCDDDIDGDLRPIGIAPDIGADEFRSPTPAAVHDLHIRQASLGAGQLTVSLQWTPPAQIDLQNLRFSSAPIMDTNWGSANTLPGDLSGATSAYTTTIAYGGDTVFFALRTRGSNGEWSPVSNNAFWPQIRIFLPQLIH